MKNRSVHIFDILTPSLIVISLKTEQEPLTNNIYTLGFHVYTEVLKKFDLL